MTINNDGSLSAPNLQNSFCISRSANEDKVYQLVLGKILPGICLAIACASTTLAVTVSPFFIIGAISFFPIALAIYELMHAQTGSIFTETNPSPVTNSRAPLGLQNNGTNDCWANAAIQLITHCEPLMNKIEESPWNKWFVDVSKKYQDESQKRSKASSPFGQELRSGLLDGHHRVNSMTSMEDPCIILEKLYHQVNVYERTIDSVPARDETGRFIDLSILPNSNFQQMIRHHFQYTSDQNQQISRKITQTPPYLIMRIKRETMQQNWFTQQFELCKNQEKIPVSFEVTLEPEYVKNAQEQKYECCSFLVHQGYSLNRGHYIAYVKKNNSWWLCNDSSVSEVTEQTAKNAARDAYVLCYKPRTPEAS